MTALRLIAYNQPHNGVNSVLQSARTPGNHEQVSATLLFPRQRPIEYDQQQLDFGHRLQSAAQSISSLACEQLAAVLVGTGRRIKYSLRDTHSVHGAS